MISRNYKKNLDQIITIGDPAKFFAKRKRYKQLASYDDLDNSSKNVGWLVHNLISINQFDVVKIVAFAPHIKDEPYQLFPILETGNIKEIENEFKKIRFFSSLLETLKNISHTYMTNAIEGIYEETKRHFYQEKFAKHEGSLKTIDDKMLNFERDLNKEDRKLETEELIHTTQISKRK